MYKLVFDVEGDEVDFVDVEVPTARQSASHRLKSFTSDDSFGHGDHVRAGCRYGYVGHHGWQRRGPEDLGSELWAAVRLATGSLR